MLSLEKSRLAGYMLTGNRSMFLETEGSLAWLYICPLVRSPLHTMNECYDKIPIFYKGQIKFVDPITGQTLPDAMPQNCSNHIENLFQMDMDDKNSINQRWNVHKRPANRILGQHPHEFCIKESFTKVHKKALCSFALKERT